MITYWSACYGQFLTVGDGNIITLELGELQSLFLSSLKYLSSQ